MNRVDIVVNIMLSRATVYTICVILLLCCHTRDKLIAPSSVGLNSTSALFAAQQNGSEGGSASAAWRAWFTRSTT